MKRTILSLLVLFMATMAWADDITAQQALQQAQSFLKQREADGSRPKRVKGSAASQLTMVKQVSGLYLFNVNDDGGFVIVSNDDSTVPILGFSDSGAIDPDNMPSNMRAWLQGYADEIEWAKKHIVASPLKALKASNAGAVKAPRRVGSHSTTAIAPLLTTKWDQIYPYNAAVANQTGYNLATGCVATAMAQVMYYTETKAGNSTTTTTSKIPSYTTSTYGFSMPAIPAGSTLNWSNMIDSYSGDYTSAQATAVAYLMMYCGCSVKMDYGPSSGAQTSYVATALKNYFGYKTTTQYLSRSFYTYANWTDLLYHELSQGRPVVYGGQATDNGHCFVCDGYKFENSTDLFHINWGWSGQSDGYFVLSVLNPDEQGVGGSATNSAYTSGQEAVVGIQKIGGTGTVLDANPHAPNLSLISTEASHATIALGESVDVTVKVKNNGEYIYDGDICLAVNGSLGVSKMFEIPSGATQDCVITFTPQSVGSYTLGAYIPNPSGGGDYVGSINLGGSFKVVNQTPTDLVAMNITSTTANVGWTNVGDASKWNIRKRSVAITEEDFNGEVSGWGVIDWNGDGTKWSLSSNAGIDGTPCYVSPSYKGGDLDPDDGLKTPKISLGGTFSFYAKGNDEHFVIYLSTNNFNYSSISGEIVATDTWTRYEFDLGAYAGKEGWIVIDHCNSSGHTSTSYLCVDDVTFVSSPGAWTTSEVASNSYFLTELSEETNYQVMVQPVINDGGNWSAPISFKTNNIKLGDANVDTNVTITDAVSVVNYILGNPSADFSKVAANVNGDLDAKGEPNITITDAVGVVNIILNSGGSAPKMEAPDAEPVEATEPE